MNVAAFLRLSRRELIALTALFILSLPAVTLRIYASDEVQYYSYLRSLWFDRDVSFENEYRHFYDSGVIRTSLFADTFLDPPSETGLRRNFATVGSAILWAPFYAVADVGVRIARAVGSDVEADGYSRPYVAAVCLGSAVYGFLAILLSVRLARMIAGTGVRAGILVWIGTPLFFYMYLTPGFAHATSAFAVAAFISVWLRVRRGWNARGVMLLAAAGALMTMVREQDAFFALGPIVDFMRALVVTLRQPDHAGERSKLLGGAVVLGVLALATFVVAFSPQLAAYQAINARFGPSPLVARKMLWSSPHALQVLLDPGHGFFLWTPLAMLALAGLVWAAAAAAEHRHVAIGLLVMFVMGVYITGSVDSWTAAGAFGQRRFVSLTPLLIVGLAVLFARIPRRTPVHAALLACVGLALWWNIALMAQFGAHLMNRQGLELRRNAYTAFVTLPRIGPQLAYRYVFDRQSFYKAPPPQ